MIDMILRMPGDDGMTDEELAKHHAATSAAFIALRRSIMLCAAEELSRDGGCGDSLWDVVDCVLEHSTVLMWPVDADGEEATLDECVGIAHFITHVGERMAQPGDSRVQLFTPRSEL